MDQLSISMTINSSFNGEIFPRIGLAVTDFKLPAGKQVKVYNGRGDDENRIKEGKNTLRRDKTSCHRFTANQVRLLIGVMAYNILQMLRRFYLPGEEVKRSIEWLIKGLIGPVFSDMNSALTYGYMGVAWSFFIPLFFGIGFEKPYLWVGQKTPGTWEDVD